MAKSTPELIEDVLSNYKENMSYILLGFAFLSALLSGAIQYFQNLSLAKKVEEYKNELTQKEIKFTRYTEMQIECYKKFYDIIVSLHFIQIKFNSTSRFTHYNLKKQCNTIDDNYNETMDFSHRNKILLTQEITDQTALVLIKLSTLITLLNTELKRLSRLEEDLGKVNTNTELHELVEIRNNKEIKSLGTEIELLRAMVEHYFIKLVS